MNILLVAYYYLPDISGGSERPKNFMNYLNKLGLNTYLLTASYDRIEYVDDDRIIRVKDYRRNDSGLFRTAVIRGTQTLMRKFGKPIRPEDFWGENVKRCLPGIMEKVKADVCIASFPPPVVLDIGLYIKEKYPDVKLIADFRDGFLYSPMYDEMKDDSKAINREFMKRYRNLELDMVQKSDAVLTISDTLSDYFMMKYGTKKVFKITNGFNHEEVIDAEPARLPDDKFVILYTGSLDGSRKGYFEYFKEFVESGRLDKYDAVVVLIGHYKNYERKYLEKQERVIMYPPMRRDIVIATQRRADMLLNVIGENAMGALNGKLFEYIFARKPILNIGKHPAIEQFLSETDSGKSFSLSDGDGLDQYVEDIKEKRLTFTFRNTEKYTREYGARQLAGIINSVMER